MTKKIVFLIIITIGLVLPFFALAGNLSGPIVPCGRDENNDGVLDKDEACTLCDIFLMIQNIIDFILLAILIIAPVFVVVGGVIILSSSGSPEKVGLGKTIIFNTVIGVAIAFLSWTILNMLFNTLLPPGGFPWPWNEVRCVGGGVSEGEEEREVYTYCHLQYKDEPDVMALNYDTEEDCSQECPKLCDLVIPRDKCEAWCCLDQNKSGQDNVCEEISEEEWCQRPAPSGSNVWVLSGINSKQKGDASPQLTSFLNCMYGRISNLQITSISSDILCNSPSCNISGPDCGHTANACHFGGTNCAGYSYAVDFATNINCSTIRTAALACNSSAWVNWEPSKNHTHVSINNRACGCNEGTSGNPCPN